MDVLKKIVIVILIYSCNSPIDKIKYVNFDIYDKGIDEEINFEISYLVKNDSLFFSNEPNFTVCNKFICMLDEESNTQRLSSTRCKDKKINNKHYYPSNISVYFSNETKNKNVELLYLEIPAKQLTSHDSVYYEIQIIQRLLFVFDQKNILIDVHQHTLKVEYENKIEYYW